MKSLITLFLNMYTDVYMCAGATPDPRDILYVTRRTKEEGLSFLTITLPSFASDLEQALERGVLTPDLFPSFRKRASSSIPAFLQGMTELIFSDLGTYLEDPSIVAVQGIRQLCVFAKRLEMDCTEHRRRMAFNEYVELDGQVIDEESISSDSVKEATMIWNALFQYLDPCRNRGIREYSITTAWARCSSREASREREVLYAMALSIRDDVFIRRLLGSELAPSFRIG